MLESVSNPAKVQSAQGFQDLKRLIMWHLPTDPTAALPDCVEIIWQIALCDQHPLAQQAQSCLVNGQQSNVILTVDAVSLYTAAVSDRCEFATVGVVCCCRCMLAAE